MVPGNATPPAVIGPDGSTDIVDRSVSGISQTPRATADEPLMAALIDPRLGDIEDDASSTKRRSLFAMAGSLLAEISFPKLFLAWLLLIALPGVLLGLAPLIISGWLATLSRKVAGPLNEAWPLLLLLLVVVAGYLGGRHLYRLAESGFWSLNSVAVQPGYALCRESLRHLVELVPRGKGDPESRARLRAATAAGAGLILCGIALSVIMLVWPATRWLGAVADLASPQRLIVPALANAVAIVSGYLAAASLAWGLADATMDQPRDLPRFDDAAAGARIWRVAQLSDLHVVGERYGFRIESGRSGPRGNGRLERVLARLDQAHGDQPLDFVLVTGDVTDAGRSAEWAEFMSALARYPRLSARTLILPGNHDVNVVDRANPARLDLPTSPGRRLRQMRALSAMAAMQGAKAHIIDQNTKRIDATLSDALTRHRPQIAAFADRGTLRLSAGLSALWDDLFPMVIPPDSEDGLGVLLINSTAETHFSFTNALGLVSSTQARRILAVFEQFPRAHWILAIHHHLIEYPKLAIALSERIGTALINGSWFVRQLQPMGQRMVAMHGHRHIDWIGMCGSLRIVSAPSPVMEATNEQTTCFYIHRLAAGPDGRLLLLEPERMEIAGEDEVAE
jgi:predicted MPP superfamily phosphohydrolase